MSVALIILASLALLGVMEGGYHLVRFLLDRRGQELRRRLESGAQELVSDTSLLRRGRFSSIASLDAWLAGQGWARGVERALEQADSSLSVSQVVALSAIGLAGGLTGGALVGLAPALALGGAGAAAPWAFLSAARSRRGRALSAQLPDALEMMSRSLRAGHALTSAFQLVATEMPEPISVEFARAYEQQKLGMALERAVREIAARSPRNGDLKIFAVSTVVQKETGGNLAEILDGIAKTVRDRTRFFGKLRALTAEGRASAWVVSLLPVGLAIFLVITQPAYMRRLIDNDLGRSMLAFGVLAWVAGAVWFHRLTKFDF